MNGVRKATAYLELNLLRDVEEQQESIWGNVCPLLIGSGEPDGEDCGSVFSVLAIFALVLPSGTVDSRVRWDKYTARKICSQWEKINLENI